MIKKKKKKVLFLGVKKDDGGAAAKGYESRTMPNPGWNSTYHMIMTLQFENQRLSSLFTPR